MHIGSGPNRTSRDGWQFVKVIQKRTEGEVKPLFIVTKKSRVHNSGGWRHPRDFTTHPDEQDFLGTKLD